MLGIKETNNALITVIKLAQSQQFSSELLQFRKSKELEASNKFLNSNPFLNDFEMIV